MIEDMDENFPKNFTHEKKNEYVTQMHMCVIRSFGPSVACRVKLSNELYFICVHEKNLWN